MEPEAETGGIGPHEPVTASARLRRFFRVLAVAIVAAACLVVLATAPKWGLFGHSKFAKIRLGMTEDQVNNILGPIAWGILGSPAIRNPTAKSPLWSKLSVWKTDEGFVAIAFDLEGRAAAKQLYPGSMADPDYEKIRVDMFNLP